jgi:hypothetical protein
MRPPLRSTLWHYPVTPIPHNTETKAGFAEGLPAKEAAGNKGGFWRRITGQESCRYQNGIVKETAGEGNFRFEYLPIYCLI